MSLGNVEYHFYEPPPEHYPLLVRALLAAIVLSCLTGFWFLVFIFVHPPIIVTTASKH
jgi:hypothetical protein